MTKEVVPSSPQALVSKAPAILKELQGLTFSLLAGQTTPDLHALSAIRPEDTIVSALNNNAGTITDITANVSIVDTRASGTLTCASVVAADTVTVAGKVYTAIANGATPTGYSQFSVSTTNALCAANLCAAINGREGNLPTARVFATVLSNVVTVKAVVPGIGNGPVVTDTGSTITISNTLPYSVTATFVSAGNTDAVTVNGVAFTIKTTPVTAIVDRAILGSDTLQAADMAAGINAYELAHGTLGVTATSALGVLTIVPTATRTGNAIDIAASAHVTASATTLLGGLDTGGVSSTSTTNQMILVWLNKR